MEEKKFYAGMQYMLFCGNSMNLFGISTVHIRPSSGGTLLETPNSRQPTSYLST